MQTLTEPAAKANESAAHPTWGQRFGAASMGMRPTSNHENPSEDRHPIVGQAFGPAAGLPPGAELYARPGSACDLAAGVRTNRVVNGAFCS
jgi:hypothetical protein